MYVELRHDSQKELDYALKKFNKQLKDAELFETLKKKEHYNKKSVRLKLKRNEALKRRRREEAKAKKKKKLNNGMF